MFTWSLCLCVFVHWENRPWQDVQKLCSLSLGLCVFMLLCIGITGSDKMYRSVHCQIATAAAEQIVVSRNDIRWFSFAFVLFVSLFENWIYGTKCPSWAFHWMVEIIFKGCCVRSARLGGLSLSPGLACQSSRYVAPFQVPLTLKVLQLKKLLSFPHSDNFPVSHIHPGILLLLLGGPGDIPEKLNMFSISSLFLF